MARVCRGGTLAPGPGQTWTIPALPGDEGGAQCTESGGVIEDSSSSCGSSTSSTHNQIGSTSSALILSTAVLEPVRRMRTMFAQTDLVTNLSVVNDSPELIKVILSQPAIAQRMAELVGFVSQLATPVLSRAEKDPILKLQYRAEFHEWVTKLAGDIKSQLQDYRLHEALDHAVGTLEAQVGRTYGDIVSHLRPGTTAS
jgi:hypothetical protein